MKVEHSMATGSGQPYVSSAWDPTGRKKKTRQVIKNSKTGSSCRPWLHSGCESRMIQILDLIH